MSQETGIANQGTKPFEVSEAKDIADFYGIPQSIVNLFWVKLGGTAYPKAPFKVMQAQKKGVQRVELKLVEKSKDNWECEVSIFPKLTGRELDFLTSVSDPAERKQYFEYFTKPTTNYGRANLENVKMSTMHKFLPEMAVTRGVSRTCGIYAGVGGTTYEELPDAELDSTDIDDARERIKHAKVVKSAYSKIESFSKAGEVSAEELDPPEEMKNVTPLKNEKVPKGQPILP